MLRPVAANVPMRADRRRLPRPWRRGREARRARTAARSRRAPAAARRLDGVVEAPRAPYFVVRVAAELSVAAKAPAAPAGGRRARAGAARVSEADPPTSKRLPARDRPAGSLDGRAAPSAAAAG